jgi:uncharacterized FlaG/YvyC family protein
MNIKGVLGGVIPSDIRPVARVDKGIKADSSSSDRDANGQMAQDQGQKKHPPMNDEQKKKALEHLRSLAVVKDNSLSVEWASFENKNIVLIKEPSGKIVRRIPEEELWSLQSVQNSGKGQLLRKTA